MTLSINTNIAALTAHQNMLSTDADMNTSLERLSTGLRINSAADDASGMTIADSLRSQHLGIGQGIQNANEAVSIVETADGALEESINIVNTIKTKAIQAASDSQTADTRSAIQEDIDKLIEELDSIAQSTSYNGQQLLSGEFTNKSVQYGASSNETATINISSASSTQTGHISTATLGLDDEDGGEVQLTLTSAITGEEVELETIEILMNNDAENGMGALADEINSQTYLTGISANAVVESTTEEAIQEGATGSDFSINGVTIGAVSVSDNDSDAALVTAINDKSTETGVSAAINADGTLTLTSDDGRAIEVTGDTGDVFGDQSAEDMSTIGYITLTQSGSSQFNIEGSVSGGIEDDLTLNDDLTTTEDSVISAGSTVASGSTLAQGSVLGGSATVALASDTLSEYELAEGSTLEAGSVLAEGTVIGGTVTVDGSGANVTVDQEMVAAEDSTLLTGTVLAAGTILSQDITVGGTTYSSGTELNSDLTLDADVTLVSDMTLGAGSEIADDSTLASGSSLGSDITTAAATTITDAITLEAGSTIAAGSELATGSVLGDDTTLSATMTSDEETELAAGSTIVTGSVLAEDSEIEETLTVASVTLDEAMTLEAGSTLAATSVLVAGTTIEQDMELDIGGTTSIVEAGTTLSDDATVVNDTTLTEEMTVEAGSTLADDSELSINTENTGEVELSDQESLTLSDLSVMTQEDAQIAIDIADAALADLDATRSGLGSVQNQLDSTIANLTVTEINLQSAESTIRDVDFAEETSNYATLQLLSQTSSYALAQANSSTENLLSLMQ